MLESSRVLYVEDHLDSAEMLQFALERKGLEVVCCPTSDQGLAEAETKSFLAIVLDHRLADITGFEVCREIRTYDKETVIIIYTASAYPQDIREGLEAGADYYFVKPLDFPKVTEIITRLKKERGKLPGIMSSEAGVLSDEFGSRPGLPVSL